LSPPHEDHDHGDHDGHDHDGHDHGHDHGTHHHAPATFGLAFAVGIGLNAGFVVVEAVAGLLANSTALLADAGHNLGDVLGLIAAWVASRLAQARPSARYSYGLRSSSILAALTNGVVLMLATGAIGWEATMRLAAPQPLQSSTVVMVASLGILINGVTAWLFARGASQDLNIRGAFLHMTADAAVSAGVVLAAALIPLTGWLWLDPVAGLLICAVIVASTWGLLRDALAMSMNAAPAWIDPDRVRAHLLEQPGVIGLHDLHIWPMSTTEVALTCHLVMPDPPRSDAFLLSLAASLASVFRIGHPTIQIETSADGGCHLAPDEVV
jgi:cobalt-zinc-cadmium efflux system protein